MTSTPKLTDDLGALYSQMVDRRDSQKVDRQSEEIRDRCQRVNRERFRNLDRLAGQGVVTVGDLIARLPSLSPGRKRFGIELVYLLKVRQAVPVLLELLSDRAVRLACADALCGLNSGKKVTQLFIQIGRRELESDEPDKYWLEAVISGLRFTDDRRAAEILVTIFERTDLLGWLRGNAADKLGCVNVIRDRRTRLFQRCRDAALRGLVDPSIDVQFWSMYLIGSLCSDNFARRGTSQSRFDAALPTLRKIAATDHRLAPGYWWPMSAEAEDVIGCIETGQWPEPDAAERWLGHTERGKMDRD